VTHDDSAREAARRADGKFGPQHHTEADITLPAELDPTDPAPLDPATLPDGQVLEPTDSPAAAAALGTLARAQTSNSGDPEHACVLADYHLTAEQLGGRSPEDAWSELAGTPNLNDEWADDSGPGLTISLRSWITDDQGAPRGKSLTQTLAELQEAAATAASTLTTKKEQQ
jgi:hypothetical protein